MVRAYCALILALRLHPVALRVVGFQPSPFLCVSRHGVRLSLRAHVRCAARARVMDCKIRGGGRISPPAMSLACARSQVIRRLGPHTFGARLGVRGGAPLPGDRVGGRGCVPGFATRRWDSRHQPIRAASSEPSANVASPPSSCLGLRIRESNHRRRRYTARRFAHTSTSPRFGGCRASRKRKGNSAADPA